TPPGAAATTRAKVRQVAEHEYRIMSRLASDRLLRPRDLVDSDLGVGLVYPMDDRFQRLDLWLADNATSLSAAEQLSLLRRLAEAFQAPEGVWNREADRVRLDVFALGALAYYILAGRPAAADRAALRERLHRDNGLDLAADLPQVPPAVRTLVLEATRPTVSERLADVR